METRRGNGGTQAKYGCPVEVTAEILSGKWKCVILWWLRNDAKSFSELLRLMPGISRKVLTEQLRQLERNALILRHAETSGTNRVNYSLGLHGNSLRPLIDLMCAWGKEILPGFRFGYLALDNLDAILVEVQSESREALIVELQDRGVQVRVFNSAAEALVALRAISEKRPNILLMQVGTLGETELLRWTRSGNGLKAIPTVAIAGDNDARLFALKEGFSTCFVSPVEPAELAAAMASLTGVLD